MNTVRVDVANTRRTPCGMNSIKYIGNSFEEARRVYNATDPGSDAWGQPNQTYGVILSVWHPERHEYVIKCVKGLS